MLFRDFKGPGVHFGSLGAQFEDISDFYDFGDVRFCAFWRLPVWRLLTPVVGKNRSEKKMQKVVKLGSASQAGKTIPSGVGLLKNKEDKTIRHPNNGPNTPSRA